MGKDVISRETFEQNTMTAAVAMHANTNFMQEALNLKVKAGHDYLWVHQTRWMGEPCLQLPTDLLALAEIINRTKPDYIIECGVAWGGTTLFLASMLALNGGKLVIGVDIYLPEDLKRRINSHDVSEKIHLIEGSTLADSTLIEIDRVLRNSKKVMVLLDSDHTHEHVIRELEIYNKYVGLDFYLICGDTAIEMQPPAPNRPRSWGKGNNPLTALTEFLKSNEGKSFDVDLNIDKKLLFSNNWGGHIIRNKL